MNCLGTSGSSTGGMDFLPEQRPLRPWGVSGRVGISSRALRSRTPGPTTGRTLWVRPGKTRTQSDLASEHRSQIRRLAPGLGVQTALLDWFLVPARAFTHPPRVPGRGSNPAIAGSPIPPMNPLPHRAPPLNPRSPEPLMIVAHSQKRTGLKTEPGRGSVLGETPLATSPCRVPPWREIG
jgi:hypothetical protein